MLHLEMSKTDAVLGLWKCVIYGGRESLRKSASKVGDYRLCPEGRNQGGRNQNKRRDRVELRV